MIIGQVLCAISNTSRARGLAEKLWDDVRESKTETGEIVFAILTILHNLPKLEDPESGKIIDAVDVLAHMDQFVGLMNAQQAAADADAMMRRVQS